MITFVTKKKLKIKFVGSTLGITQNQEKIPEDGGFFNDEGKRRQTHAFDKNIIWG